MVATKIERTCELLPSQWEGWLLDGRMFYARYRHGDFSFRVSNERTNDVFNAVCGEVIFEIEVDNDLDGCMSDEQMMDITSPFVNWTNVEWIYDGPLST